MIRQINFSTEASEVAEYCEEYIKLWDDEWSKPSHKHHKSAAGNNQGRLNSIILKQVNAYKDITQSEIGQVLKEAQTAQLTHPVPILRAKEIEKWSSSPDYAKLLQNGKVGYNDSSENKRGWRNW